MITLDDLSRLGFVEYKEQVNATSVFVNIEKHCMLFPNGNGFIPYFGIPTLIKYCEPGVMITDIEKLQMILNMPI